ncbi:hypothetical protein SAMN04244579_04305 [Azotobacter beijerinckii]|uniref:Uncharacterized protein n=1 Tax=Azotobacter beijerinckii TaxID=170623 RepID=A0A1H6YYQ5_9GAMM|nr:hypothetical protein [Azotobacter beijerinckii]SEJ42512.1 hypothetical protein SAMN04244579_04305 [Azotobacter beijerinckii]
MNVPTYCRSTMKRIGACDCYRYQPVTKPAPAKTKEKDGTVC